MLEKFKVKALATATEIPNYLAPLLIFTPPNRPFEHLLSPLSVLQEFKVKVLATSIEIPNYLGLLLISQDPRLNLPPHSESLHICKYGYIYVCIYI
jgi:hypothetical protein